MIRYLARHPSGGWILLSIAPSRAVQLEARRFSSSEAGSFVRFASLDDLVRDSIVMRRLAHEVVDRLADLGDGVVRATCSFLYPTTVGRDQYDAALTRQMTIEFAIDWHPQRAGIRVVQLYDAYPGVASEAPTILPLVGT